MKKVWFILFFFTAFVGFAAQAHATTFTQETKEYKMTIVTTDTGAFLVVNPKKSIDAYPVVLDQAYVAGSSTNNSHIVLNTVPLTFDTPAVYWLGGLSSNTTYYFYPYNPAVLEQAGLKTPVIVFKTNSANTTSGSYQVSNAPGATFSNGTLPFVYIIPATEKRAMSVSVIPRGSLGKLTGPIDFSKYPTIDLSSSMGGKASATGLAQGKSYVFVMHPTTGSGWDAVTAARIETGAPQNIVAKDPVFKSTGTTTEVSGQIDTASYDAPEDLCITLEYIDAQAGTFQNNQDPEGRLTATAKTSLDARSPVGVNHDGTYYWVLKDIDPNKYYSFRESFHLKGNGGQCNAATIGSPLIGKFNGDKGLLVVGTTAQQQDFESRSYRLLAPLPGLSVLLDPDLCREQQIENPGKGQICDINDFLNYVFRLLIGVAAVILVLRIMIEGFKYATSDVVSIKVSSKEKLWQGVWGLLLALSAWLILNTINPKLVENNINLPSVELNIDSFNVGGSLGGEFRTWKPIKINFNTEAYPAAKRAEEKTGVQASLILAIFDQETRSGSGGTGGCTINNTRIKPEDITAFGVIVRELSLDKNTTPVSCAFKDSSGNYQGYGGAIGYAQSLPGTWNNYKKQIKTNLGKSVVNPWNVDDALMFIGVFMKNNGGATDPYQGACHYFGRCSFGGVDYAAQVMSRKAAFEKEIAQRKSAGKIQ